MNPLQRRRLLEIRCQQIAQEVYASFSESEKRGVEFGLFPQAKIEPQVARLIVEHEQAEGRNAMPEELREITRLLSMAIMDAPRRTPDTTVH